MKRMAIAVGLLCGLTACGDDAGTGAAAADLGVDAPSGLDVADGGAPDTSADSVTADAADAAAQDAAQDASLQDTAPPLDATVEDPDAGPPNDADTTAVDAADAGVDSTVDAALDVVDDVDAAAPDVPDAAGDPVADPAKDGPHSFQELEASTKVAATGHDVPLRVIWPTPGPVEAPWPLVVIGHGFQLPTSQYVEYGRRLATHGFVVVLPDFPTSFLTPSHLENAEDMRGALDWAAADAQIGPLVDMERIGMTGHSLGGKVALLAATLDPRIDAVIALDPVDSAVNCPPAKCPDVSALMPVGIPTGFLGETTDATGLIQACAPAADNFLTFYANTTAPTFAVTVVGANHMSFLDDVATCGITCSFCNKATAEGFAVTDLSRAYVTAFFQRWLRAEPAYDAYLTGAEAGARYVATGLATIQSK